jgi:sugar-specific transcriptional regulator TrmB
METDEILFAALGISSKHSRVYLSLVKEGPSSVRQLALATGMNRGTVYDVLKELQANGLVRFYNAETRQYFVAESPKRLEELAVQKGEAFRHATQELSRVVAQFETWYHGGDRQPIVRMYEGQEGVATILHDVLLTMEASRQKIYFVYSSGAVRNAGLYHAFPDFTAMRIAKGIRVKNITFGASGKTAGLDERKHIEGAAGAPTYVLLFAGKVANIFLDPRGEFTGLIIENRAMYETQKVLFEELWNRLP